MLWRGRGKFDVSFLLNCSAGHQHGCCVDGQWLRLGKESCWAVQITMGGWLMNIAWLIFILFAYFGFEDPLKKRKDKEKCALAKSLLS